MQYRVKPKTKKNVKPLNAFKEGLLYTAIISTFSASAFGDDAQVGQKVLSINLPQQSLARSITRVAANAGLSVVLKPGQFQQQTASPLSGQITLDDALTTLLQGTGFNYEVTEGKLKLVKSLSSPSNKTLDVVNNEKIIVYGTNASRYNYDEAETATGFIADIDELPRDVQVIPEQVILDQNAEDLTDVLVNAAGVTRAHGFGGAETQVNIRGFTNNLLFLDGNPVSPRFNIDVANIERAEVILGPASILHGQVNPGGLVNIITKKPQKESAHVLQVELDEHGKQKTFLDSTGALNDEFQYRIVLSAEGSETFRESQTADGIINAERESVTIAPSISYTPDEKNTFTLRYSYTDQRLPIDRGTVAVTDANGNINIAELQDRRLGSQFDERNSIENLVQLDWDYELDNGWVNRLKTGYFDKNFSDFQARPFLGFDGTPTNLLEVLQLANTNGVQANGLLGRTLDSNISVTERDVFLSNSLAGDYTIGDVDNTLYIGANLYKRTVQNGDGIALTDVSALFGPNTFAPTIDIIDINSSANASFSVPDQSLISRSDDEFTEYGLTFQNLSYLTNELTLLAGIRYDRFDGDGSSTVFYDQNTIAGAVIFTPRNTPQELTFDSSNDNISGQIGATYDINDQVTLYASYSESFLPNYPIVTTGVLSNSENFDPEESNQFEIGAKTSFLDDKLRLTVSAYDLERENVLRFANLQAFLNGEERSRGVDVSATMQFVPGLNVIATYSYIDAEIINDNDDSLNNEGNRPFSVPEHKARIWGSYEFQQGDLAGLGIGLGAEYVGERFGNDANTFTLPDYTLFDTAAWYYIPLDSDVKLRVQAGIKNLTDEVYFPANGSGTPFRINVGDPRTAYLTARLEF